MGVYCNGANDEEDKLIKFWFNYVSTDGKKEYQRKLKEKKDKAHLKA